MHPHTWHAASAGWKAPVAPVASGSSSSAPYRVAIVTGAGSGIGRAIARTLSIQGHALALAGRRPEALDETGRSLPGPWIAIPCDVTDPTQCKDLVEEVASKADRLDVLVNNAGDAPLATIADHTPELIRSTLEVNALGPAYLIAAAWRVFDRLYRHSPRHGPPSPCIVNIGSMASLDPFPGFFAYAAAKSACDSMIRSCHKEGQSMGIRCFAIAPGAVETSMLRRLFDTNTIPREKALQPEDIARVVAECVLGIRDNQMGTTIPLVR